MRHVTLATTPAHIGPPAKQGPRSHGWMAGHPASWDETRLWWAEDACSLQCPPPCFQLHAGQGRRYLPLRKRQKGMSEWKRWSLMAATFLELLHNRCVPPGGQPCEQTDRQTGATRTGSRLIAMEKPPTATGRQPLWKEGSQWWLCAPWETPPPPRAAAAPAKGPGQHSGILDRKLQKAVNFRACETS